MNRVWSLTGHKPRELQIPPLPAGMEYLPGLFWECKRTSEPLTWQELQAWSRLMDRKLDPEEYRALMKMDAIQCRVAHEA
ncbi:hypothetical protein NJC38_00885 [Pseudomonas sp. 21LCFQ010]|uniref:phage tail assembly chaperone n=1 Tax=Pseudomonas sp. 21LCFQ010 TaxID=2957506 RepID=UPI002096AB7E|nr:hypothetical protein [Pseudomonas sp. 21LCFQ010]MCO8160718.1 hypothetical protein [Pseudomonas sp. 21LCFQ010]